MGQSHAKRRRRERPIRRHRDVAAREFQDVCEKFGFDPSNERRRALIDEAVRMASPFAFSGIDAAIPAGRKDLMREWYFLRLSGLVEAPAEVERMARVFCPSPDDVERHAGRRRVGDPSSASVAAAFENAEGLPEEAFQSTDGVTVSDIAGARFVSQGDALRIAQVTRIRI